MKVCALSMYVRKHVDYDYVLLCIVLGLKHGCSYLTVWVYDSYIDDDMIVWGWLKNENGYSYVLIEWLVICVKVNMWCSFLIDLCSLLDACMNMNMWCFDLGL